MTKETKRFFGASLPVGIIQGFRTEADRQGRKRAAMLEKVIQYFINLPPLERERIASGR